MGKKVSLRLTKRKFSLAKDKSWLNKSFKGKKIRKDGMLTKRYEYWLQASPLAFKKLRR